MVTTIKAADEGVGRPGVGVDAHGLAVIDPTDAVRSLVEANKKAADAEMMWAQRISDERFAHLKKLLLTPDEQVAYGIVWASVSLFAVAVMSLLLVLP